MPTARLLPVRHRSVLIVDDQPDLREALGVMFEAEGCSVFEVANGREALAYLASGVSIDAIVLDLEMPVMDGWTFLARQREHPVWREIPTIVVTGLSLADRRAECLTGRTLFTKPFHFDDLFSAIQEVLRAPAN